MPYGPDGFGQREAFHRKRRSPNHGLWKLYQDCATPKKRHKKTDYIRIADVHALTTLRRAGGNCMKLRYVGHEAGSH